MHSVEPARWDDYILAALLLLIGVPRAILGLVYDQPLGVEGTLALACVVFALFIVLRRIR